VSPLVSVSPRRSKYTWASIPAALGFGLTLAVFLALTLFQLSLPGPNYDEAVEAQPAVQVLRGLPVEAHRDATITVAGGPRGLGMRLPLMIVDYVGALNTYVLLAYFKLGGISVPVMRLWPLTVAVIILWLTYRLGVATAGPRAGLLAAWLLAVQPSFVFFSRQGIYVTNTTIALSLGILLALRQLSTTGRLRWWFLAALLAGVGLWAKFIMLWPLVATAALAPVVWLLRRPLDLHVADSFRPRLLLSPKALVGALAAFLLGMAPFLLFNFQTGATFKHFLGTLNESYYGVANTDYLGNLVQRAGQLRDFLAGDHFWYLGSIASDRLAFPVWLAGLGIALLALVFGRRAPGVRRLALAALLFYAFTALLLLQSPLTPTALWYTHLAVFSPYLALAVATAWDIPFRLLGGRTAPWVTSATAVVFACVLGISSLTADVNYHRALAISGGLADHSDTSYRLADYLRQAGISKPYALDWGFKAPLILISQGEVDPVEIFGYERVDAPPEGVAEAIREHLQDPNAVFLLHMPERTNFPGRAELLDSEVVKAGKELEIIEVIRERSGAQHTVVLRQVSQP